MEDAVGLHFQSSNQSEMTLDICKQQCRVTRSYLTSINAYSRQG